MEYGLRLDVTNASYLHHLSSSEQKMYAYRRLERYEQTQKEETKRHNAQTSFLATKKFLR